MLQASVTELQARVEELRLRRAKLTQQNATLKDMRAALWAEGKFGDCWPKPSQSETRQEQVQTGAVFPLLT